MKHLISNVFLLFNKATILNISAIPNTRSKHKICVLKQNILLLWDDKFRLIKNKNRFVLYLFLLNNDSSGRATSK